jgi:hypothetical protein
MSASPVALFVYNRPDHTRRTIDALQLNRLAAVTNLFVYSDGPKSEADRPKVQEVRDLLRGYVGFRSVCVRESSGNLGLANSIITGVTEIVERFGRVIVLEDDILTAPCFLSFMNDALDCYQDAERVMHISGYCYPVKFDGEPETFFMRYPTPWGWATWQRAWRCFEKDPKELQASMSRSDVSRFNLDGAVDFWEQVMHNVKGKADTWAVFWYASIFRQNGLCLYPARSLTQNIGMDGTGQHCLITNAYENQLDSTNPRYFTDEFKEDVAAINSMKDFYATHRISRLMRFLKLVSLRLGKKFGR